MNKEIVQNFIDEQYQRIICDQCLNTFMTKVFDYSPSHVLLEKRTLGLEYFCHATQELNLICVPDVQALGIINEDDQIVPSQSKDKLFSAIETDFRYLYLMERMEHLNKEEAKFFDDCIQQLDSIDDATRKKGFKQLANKHGQILRHEIQALFTYSQQYQEYIVWDLHGDNLMRRNTGELVILDPFTFRI
ncbi:MAG: hypothetical protein KAH22_10125 [Thiotrichaceae bacterium]|nr:hypothetical protein [Thiotrichaceae bacterium]